MGQMVAGVKAERVGPSFVPYAKGLCTCSWLFEKEHKDCSANYGEFTLAKKENIDIMFTPR